MKFNNKEEAQAFITSKREDKETAKGELKAFCKENKLDPKADHSEDAKHGKKYKKLQGTVSKISKEIEEAKEWLNANKPEKKSKGGGGTRTTYEYPADITSEADKKRYRAKMRAAAAKGETPAKEEKSSKKDKKNKGKETPAAETTPAADAPKEGKKKKASKED